MTDSGSAPPTSAPPETLFQKLVRLSKAFEEKNAFQTEDNRIENLAKSEEEMNQIERHAKETRVILHSKVVGLIKNFLKVKREHGTHKEKRIYQDMNWKQFISRILICRPLVFFGSTDMTLLLDSEDLGSMAPTDAWSKVGTDTEDKEIKIENYMTYDEIAIAALIGVSVPTRFINNGDRNNCGRKDDEGEFESFGIYVGLTGARFEKKDKMEALHMLLTDKITTKENGYGKEADPHNPQTLILRTWAELYGEKDENNMNYFPTYQEVKDKFTEHPEVTKEHFFHYVPSNRPDLYVNIRVYKERLKLSILPFLLDAEDRAVQYGKKAYLHIVGLGLGVWQIVPEQATWMLETYKELLQQHNKNLTNVHTLDFSWFPDSAKIASKIEGDKYEHTQFVFSKRNPADALPSSDLLLVAMYAWDGNAFPGNEYWRGMLQASGDPAAACCSTITELQNPKINEDFVNYIKKWE